MFGGSFNPVHIGHLRAAEEITEMFLLDKVIFIPTSVHPFKKKDSHGAEKRFHMLQIATGSNPKFEVSDVELKREGISYTIDTLKHFVDSYENTQLYFILGTENLAKIDKWHQFQDLFLYSNFIVIERPGVKTAESSLYIPLKLRSMFTLKQAGRDVTVYEHNSLNKLIFLKIKGIDVSSSKVRNLIRDKKSIRYFIPDDLRSYILKENLYAGE